MHNLRYGVWDSEGEWKFACSGHRLGGTYPSKSEAMSAAIESGEQDGHAGRPAEVLVRNRDRGDSTVTVHHD